jgi:hypothetical protein
MSQLPDREAAETDGPIAIEQVRREASGSALPDIPSPQTAPAVPGTALPGGHDTVLFLAERQEDGTYRVALTEQGVESFETSLGVARDLGRSSRISAQATVADLMERAAMREELSALLRADPAGTIHRFHIAVLRWKLHGTERPAGFERVASHLGRALIPLLMALWSLQQFGVAAQDIQTIPGILAHIPSDILHLQLTAPFTAVGRRIADADHHLLLGLAGMILTFIAATAVRPFLTIYRKDAVVPGGRAALRLAHAGLHRLDRDR